MPNNPYNPIDSPQTLLGHQWLADQIWGFLTQPTPANVSVIGPKYSGKSTLLRALDARVRSQSETFVGSILWNLRSDTPTNDGEFERALIEQTYAILKPLNSQDWGNLVEYQREWLRGEMPEESAFEVLKQSFSAIASAKKRLVIFFDDHDSVLMQPQITENLWSHMEFLVSFPGIVFVAASKQSLAEISFNREVQNSPYWNKYDPLKHLTAFGEQDWATFFAPFEDNGFSLDGAAKREVINWSGGVPVLASELARQLFNQALQGQAISKNHVDGIAQTLHSQSNLNVLLKSIYKDLGVTKQLYFLECCQQSAKPSEWNIEARADLKRRGLLTDNGAQVNCICQLLKRHVLSNDNDLSLVRKSFGKEEDYFANFDDVLKFRLAQIKSLDPGLRKAMTRVLEAVDNPEMALGGLRAVFDVAMSVLWDKETSGTRVAPDAWRELVKDRLDGEALPKMGLNRLNECLILNTITGRQGLERMARYATKPTAILAQTVKSTGDFLNHTGGTSITPAFTFAVCLCAVELCESLARDLDRDPST